VLAGSLVPAPSGLASCLLIQAALFAVLSIWKVVRSPIK
jgi:hypothetical protein